MVILKIKQRKCQHQNKSLHHWPLELDGSQQKRRLSSLYSKPKNYINFIIKCLYICKCVHKFCFNFP